METLYFESEIYYFSSKIRFENVRYITLFGHNREISLECLSSIWTRSFFVTGDRFTLMTLKFVPSKATSTSFIIVFEIGSDLSIM